MRLLKPAVIYFLLVFGTGFVLGTIRVLLVVPLLGERTAELLEMPLMLIAIVVAAHWVNRRLLSHTGSSTTLSIGLIAMGLVLTADLVVGVALRGMSPGEALFHRDPVSGTAYYLSLLLFAAMPWLLSRHRQAQGAHTTTTQQAVSCAGESRKVSQTVTFPGPVPDTYPPLEHHFIKRTPQAMWHRGPLPKSSNEVNVPALEPKP